MKKVLKIIGIIIVTTIIFFISFVCYIFWFNNQPDNRTIPPKSITDNADYYYKKYGVPVR